MAQALAYMVRIYADFCAVPAGGGPVAVVPSGGLANEPGFGATLSAGPSPTAQTKRYQQAEIVAGGDSPTLANLQSAVATAATDLGNQITAADLAQIQGWKTGGG